jgi:hypothetical protein
MQKRVKNFRKDHTTDIVKEGIKGRPCYGIEGDHLFDEILRG